MAASNLVVALANIGQALSTHRARYEMAEVWLKEAQKVSALRHVASVVCNQFVCTAGMTIICSTFVVKRFVSALCCRLALLYMQRHAVMLGRLQCMHLFNKQWHQAGL